MAAMSPSPIADLTEAVLEGQRDKHPKAEAGRITPALQDQLLAMSRRQVEALGPIRRRGGSQGPSGRGAATNQEGSEERHHRHH